MPEFNPWTAVAFLLGAAVWQGSMAMLRRRTLRTLQIGEKRVRVSPMPEREERVFDAEAFVAAINEQHRREAAHPGPRYRTDQRVRAVQQRLSRKWGGAAFTMALRKRIEEALGQ